MRANSVGRRCGPPGTQLLSGGLPAAFCRRWGLLSKVDRPSLATGTPLPWRLHLPMPLAWRRIRGSCSPRSGSHEASRSFVRYREPALKGAQSSPNKSLGRNWCHPKSQGRPPARQLFFVGDGALAASASTGETASALFPSGPHAFSRAGG
jgi:hypothetical protein